MVSKAELKQNTEDDKILSLRTPTAFQFLWLGLLISMMGDHLNKVGLIWFVNNNFEGSIANMTLGFSMAIPTAIVGIFAGVIVDRFDRTTLMFASDLIRAILLFLLVFIFIFFEPNLIVISLFSIMLGVVGLFFGPATQSLIPDVAGNDKNKISKMGSWILGTRTTLSSAGPAIAGILVPFIAIEWVLAIDGLSFVLSFIMLLFMQKKLKSLGVTTKVNVPKGSNLLKDAKEGLGFILKHPILGPQFMFYPILEAVAFSIPFFLPELIKTNIGHTAEIFGLSLGIWMLGRVVAMAIYPKSPISKNRGIAFTANLLGQGVALFIISTAESIPVLLLGFLLMGIPGGFVMISLQTYVQTNVPNDLRGRTFATMGALGMLLTPLGILIIGNLSEIVGVQKTFVYSSFLLFICGIFIATKRQIREVK
ncbi:MFS transporter [Cytobacillus sp. Hm23]